MKRTMYRPTRLGDRSSIIVFAFACIIYAACGTCHNQCSGHGECNSYGQCECWNGFEGWDCSLRQCPSARAWSDMATDTDTAHDLHECSNMGLCDRYTHRRLNTTDRSSRHRSFVINLRGEVLFTIGNRTRVSCSTPSGTTGMQRHWILATRVLHSMNQFTEASNNYMMSASG